MMSSLAVLVAVLALYHVQSHWVREMENEDLFEGDIVRVGQGYGSIKGGRWPNNEVPYTFASAGLETAVKAAIEQYHKHTCLIFRRATRKDRSYISFYHGTGCSSPVGYYPGRVNHISLAIPGCLGVGTVIHEIGHSIGLQHEQSRPDRDKYVRILFNNIGRDSKGNSLDYNFHKATNVDSLLTPYDFSSVMHYGSTAFGIGGRQTIETLQSKNQHLLGNRAGFSTTDIDQIRRMYLCANTGTGGGDGTDVAGKCDDNSINCAYWAGIGECNKNPSYMKPNCAKSCNLCQTKPCNDQHSYCDYWKRQGECNANPYYMLAKCSKSCNQC